MADYITKIRTQDGDLPIMASEQWEELINVTTTEEVPSVLTILDKPSCFKKFAFYIELKGTSTNTSNSGIALELNKTSQWIVSSEALFGYASAFGTTNITSYGIVEMHPQGSLCVWGGQINCTNINDMTARTKFATYYNVNTVVTSIIFGTQNSTNKFGVGSIIKVYGVRA